MSIGQFKEIRLDADGPVETLSHGLPNKELPSAGQSRQDSGLSDDPLILPKLVIGGGPNGTYGDSDAEISEFERGVAHGQDSAKTQYQDTIKVMEAALETLKAQYQTLSQKIESSHLAAIRQYLEPFLPVLLRETLSLYISEVLELACSQSVHGPVELRASAQAAGQIESWLTPHSDKITLVTDESLSGLHMRLRWPSGGGDFDPQDIIESCQRRLKSILGEYEGLKPAHGGST